MRKILWMALFFFAYLWLMTSGHDHFVMEQGKTLYRAFVSWFDDAEVDFQMKQGKKNQKKSRRWD